MTQDSATTNSASANTVTPDTVTPDTVTPDTAATDAVRTGGGAAGGTAGTRRSRAALAVLALGAFAVGTAELVIVGVLNVVADDLGVSAGRAGLLVTAYALGICAGGPLLTLATIRLRRRPMLCASLAAYVAGNVIAVLAQGMGLLVAARLLTGSVHGLYVGVASAVATGLVPPERRGRAVSMIFGGIAASTVVGVPLGTLLGQAYGWRATFTAVAVLAAAVLVAVLAVVRPAEGAASGDTRAQVRFALAPRVLALLAVELVVLSGQFTAFTYLAPYLEDVTGISGGMLSFFLLVFGAASVVGTFGGGWFADRAAATTLLVGNVVLVPALGLLSVAGGAPVAAAVALTVWGVVGFGLVPPLQLRIITLAGPGGNLAATLGASAGNAGIAAGAAIGGSVMASHGAGAVPVVALVICALAVPASWATRFLRPAPPAGLRE
ncbi:MFS transporter [Streptomyces sp. XH2]|uniref:MFS transporter n=1 Tax=Streptomyces sp. XH2 TaxID=3412483 RepID=UPI003C7DD22B